MTTPYPGNTNWPSNFQKSTITGKFVGLDGAVQQGTVTFKPAFSALADMSLLTTIMPRPLVVTLDINGQFSIDLPATDDTDIAPVNWTYTVIENLAGGGGRTYSIAAPAGQTVDLSIAAPVTSDPGTLAGFNPPASTVSFTPTGTISSTDVQSAIAEVASEASALQTASQTAFTPTGTISSTDVQAAIAEVATEASALQTAAQTSFTPTGTISSTDVQAAIAEVATEAKLAPQIATQATTSLAPNAEDVTTDITVAKSFIPFSLAVDRPCWFILYCTAADRANDISSLRNETQDPAPGSGVMLEVLCTSAGTYKLDPFEAAFNMESPRSAVIAWRVKNLDTTTGVINVSLSHLPLES